jgi:hypothetical protein
VGSARCRGPWDWGALREEGALDDEDGKDVDDVGEGGKN